MELYSQLAVVLLDVGWIDKLSETLARERYCNFTLSALSNVFTTYLQHKLCIQIKSHYLPSRRILSTTAKWQEANRDINYIDVNPDIFHEEKRKKVLEFKKQHSAVHSIGKTTKLISLLTRFNEDNVFKNLSQNMKGLGVWQNTTNLRLIVSALFHEKEKET